jgi:hypothetical protein
MATEKKGVMVYLPEGLESFVGKYCEAQGLTFAKGGKTQPRLGTGIVRLLATLASGDDKVKDFPDSTVKDFAWHESRLETLESKLDPTPLIESLRSELDNRLASVEALPDVHSIVEVATSSLRSEMQTLASEVESLKKL